MAIHLLVSLSLVLFGLETALSQRQQQSQVPCLYIFGDSLVDNGNNNRLLSLARANYRPYSIDFPQAQILGFRTYIPPYTRIRGQAFLRGANFASGAACIRDETGDNLDDGLQFRICCLQAPKDEVAYLNKYAGDEVKPCLNLQFKIEQITEEISEHNP